MKGHSDLYYNLSAEKDEALKGRLLGTVPSAGWFGEEFKEKGRINTSE